MSTSFKHIRESEQYHVYPSNLEDVILDIKKVGDKYNLRPQQLESVIHFYCRYRQLEDEHLNYSDCLKGKKKYAVDDCNNHFAYSNGCLLD